jgi:hypothetical protein
MKTSKAKVSIGKTRRKPASGKLAGPAPKSVATVASQLSRATAVQVEAAKRKFAQGILARGEAVPDGQPLTPGATHVIVGKDADGTPILKRRRFSTS